MNICLTENFVCFPMEYLILLPVLMFPTSFIILGKIMKSNKQPSRHGVEQ